MQFNKLRHNTTNSILTVLLLLVFAYQIVNNVVFTHTHILADGTIITHAHPYKKANNSLPITNHSHTKNEYVLLTIFQLLFYAFITFNLKFTVFNKQHIRLPKQILPNSFKNKLLNNKSPPDYNICILK